MAGISPPYPLPTGSTGSLGFGKPLAGGKQEHGSWSSQWPRMDSNGSRLMAIPGFPALLFGARLTPVILRWERQVCSTQGTREQCQSQESGAGMGAGPCRHIHGSGTSQTLDAAGTGEDYRGLGHIVRADGGQEKWPTRVLLLFPFQSLVAHFLFFPFQRSNF